jgi:DNA-binding NarL/FixJ family response regulator
MVSLLLVDDHVLFRESLAFVLDHEPDMHVVAQAGSLAEARDVLRAAQADVAIVDFIFPNTEGIGLIGDLRSANPHAAILLLSGSDTRLDRARAVAAGVSGICYKTEPVAQVIDSIRRLAAGEVLFTPQEIIELLRLAGQHREALWADQQRIERLTPREREVLAQLGTGLSDREIAARLGISHETVRSHMVSILGKLAVDSRLQALLFAIRHDIIPLERIRQAN